LKQKELDEWAKIAVIKSQELSDEQTKKKRRARKTKKNTRGFSPSNIIEKQCKKFREKNMMGFFDKIQLENNDRYDKKLIEKKQKQKNESKKVQEFSESLVKRINSLNK
jgi:hypothetical protein